MYVVIAEWIDPETGKTRHGLFQHNYDKGGKTMSCMLTGEGSAEVPFQDWHHVNGFRIVERKPKKRLKINKKP